VVFGGVGAVGVAEPPGRVGVEQLERPLGQGRRGREVVVAEGAADAEGGQVSGELARLDLPE